MQGNSPQPPYYAVIFTSELADNIDGYNEMADKMLRLAANFDGFIGVESARDKVGITVSYWKDLESIHNWKDNVDHKIAQKIGKERWYKKFTTRIAKVERTYSFSK